MTSLHAIYDFRKMVFIYALSHRASLNTASDAIKEFISDMKKALKEETPVANAGDPFEDNEEAPSDNDIREFLIEEYGDDDGNSITLLPEYTRAFKGMSMVSLRAIYDFRKMSEIYALKHDVTAEEALKEVKQEIDEVYKLKGSNSPVFNMGNPFENDK